MEKEILINAAYDQTRIAIVEDGQLVELYMEQPDRERMVGDIYVGMITNVIEGIQAAFVDIGLEQNGFLPFEDAEREYSAVAERVVYTDKKKKGKADESKELLLKVGQRVVVQITKEPMGGKGARLTTSISLPGRFIVLIPNDRKIGISRKIVDPNERRRLRVIAKSIKPDGFGIIIRTVAVGKDVRSLNSDLETLLRVWNKVEDEIKKESRPRRIYKDMGMTSSVIRDIFSPDIDRLVVDSRKLFIKIKKYLKDVSPSLVDKLELYKEKVPIFDHYKIEEEINRSLSRKIWIKGGGYIIFDQTEAMVVIDVNSGRSIKEKDHEKNSLKIDLEAARVIGRQLRLRDCGGIIVIDFIDLRDEKNRKKVVSELKKELKKDRAAFDILPMSKFGIVQLTRERVRPSLLYQYSQPCPRCNGLGRVPVKNTIISAIERKIQSLKCNEGIRRFILKVNPGLAEYLSEGLKNRLNRIMIRNLVTIKMVIDEGLRDEDFELLPRKVIKKA